MTTTPTDRRAWVDRAACRGLDPLFDGDGSPAAIRVCKLACEVREQCLAEAMADERYRRAIDRDGLRGGLTPEQRARRVGARIK